jgi:MATE family multidrug resistance protein
MGDGLRREVRIEARSYLIWAALLPIISVASYMYDGIYIGATWTGDMRRAMVQSVALYVVVLIALVPIFGNHGLWAALVILNLARGMTLGLRYPRLEAEVAP